MFVAEILSNGRLALFQRIKKVKFVLLEQARLKRKQKDVWINRHAMHVMMTCAAFGITHPFMLMFLLSSPLDVFTPCE